MKIDALKLVAFGPFTGKVVEFAGNGPGVHIVFGANEAGKSTALRALQGLLYGFGHKVEDAWLHNYSKLAVGGVLAIPGGGVLNVTRYKRRKNDLIDDDTGQPLDQVELDRLLGHMDREAFEHAFGISHDSLRLGVESVLAAGGDLRQAFFAATSGLNTLKNVMEALDEEQGRLFSPRAKKAKVNAGIGALNDLRKKQRQASASHHQWKKMKHTLDGLRQQEADIAGEIETLTSEISLLTRHHDAMKYVAEKERLDKDLVGLGSLPDLPDDFAQRRVETQVAVSQSREVERGLTEELAEIGDKLKALTYDERLIANENLIKALAEQAHVHTKAKTDSKKLRGEIHRHMESAQRDLAVLRPGLDLDAVQSLRLSRPEKGKIQRLGAKGAKLEEAVDSAGKAIRAAQNSFEKVRSRLGQMAKPKDVSDLADCLSRAVDYGKLEDHLGDAEAQVDLLKQQADADLSALGSWSGSIEELEQSALPSEETLRRFEQEWSETDQQVADAEKEKTRLEDRIRKQEKSLSQLSPTGKVPSVDDLWSHREVRDKGWQSVRHVWLEGGEVDPDFVQAFPESRHLAQAYETSVARADHTADVLREDAETVARSDALKADIRDQKEALAEIESRREILTKEQVRLREKWAELWAPLGIAPRTPREMMAWVNKAEALRRKASDLREQRVAVGRLRETMERMMSAMRSALEKISIRVPEDISYAQTMELAKRTVSHNDELRQERRDLEHRIEALADEIRAATERKNEAEGDLKAWNRDWAQAVSGLGFSGSVRPGDVSDFILSLDDIHAELEKANDKQQRIKGMEHDRDRYARQVADAVARLAPDLNGFEPEAGAVELHARLMQDKERRQNYELLQESKDRKRAALAKERQKLAGHEETLRLLCTDARADNAEQLPEIEKKVGMKAKLSVALDHVVERLSELAAGEHLQAFVARVKSYDPDELVAKKDRLAVKKREAQEKQKALVREVALAEKELESIGGESLAATIAEEAEGLVAEIQSDVDHYVKLRLASAVLSKAMERYRESHQSPVLAAASQYFCQMTDGSFSALRADFDDKGEPVIKGARPEGGVLGVEEMSDGSRDQLFLSLRLGGLARFVQNNGPMPFIVDDVLVHFDDQRAAAALATMGELGEKTQIIFFTHHQHLVELAKETLPQGILNIHHL